MILGLRRLLVEVTPDFRPVYPANVQLEAKIIYLIGPLG